MEIVLSDYQDKYRAKLLDLHAKAFSHMGDDWISKYVEELEHKFNLGSVVLALVEGKVIGFQSFSEVGKEEGMKKYLSNKLWWAQNRDSESKLRKYYQEAAKEYGTNGAVIEYLGKTPFDVEDNDIYLGTIAIHPDYQRQGFGRRLAGDFLRDRDFRLAYVDCLEDSGAEELYLGLGFSPIMRLGPTHRTGHSSLFAGLRKSDL